MLNFKQETQKKKQELLQLLGDPGVPRCPGDISLVRCQLQGLGLRGQALQGSVPSSRSRGVQASLASSTSGLVDVRRGLNRS